MKIGSSTAMSGIVGIKTQADIDRLTESLRKERNDHQASKTELSALKGALGPWAVLKPEEVTAKIDGYDALETQANNAGLQNEEKISQIVESRIKGRLAPIERERDSLKAELGTRDTKIAEFETQARNRKIQEALRKARIAAKISDESEEHVLLLGERVFEVTDDGRVVTKDQVGCTPGLEPESWIAEMQPTHRGWWPESRGGGAQGGRAGNGGMGGENPWSAKGWNITKQMSYAKEHGTEKAAQMAEVAGSRIGATTPPK